MDTLSPTSVWNRPAWGRLEDQESQFHSAIPLEVADGTKIHERRSLELSSGPRPPSERSRAEIASITQVIQNGLHLPIAAHAIVTNTASHAKNPSPDRPLHVSTQPKRQMSEPFTLASSLVGVGWCGRISSFCSWWHGVGDGPVQLISSKVKSEMFLGSHT